MTKRLVHFRNTDRFARVENRKKNAGGDQGIVWSSCQNSSNMNGGSSSAGAGGKWLNGVQYAFQVVATTIETTTPLQQGLTYFASGMTAGGGLIAVLSGGGVTVVAPVLVLGAGMIYMTNAMWTSFTSKSSTYTVRLSRPCHIQP